MGLKRGASDALMVVAEEGLLLADELLRYRPDSTEKDSLTFQRRRIV